VGLGEQILVKVQPSTRATGATTSSGPPGRSPVTTSHCRGS